jgi:hypothetical protein
VKSDGIPTAADYQRAVYIDVMFFLTCLVGIVFTFLKAKKGGLDGRRIGSGDGDSDLLFSCSRC